MDISTSFAAHVRSRRITPALTIALTILAMMAYFFPGAPSPAEAAAPNERCTEYFFEYVDGHVDRDEICEETPVTEIWADTHGIHVPNLHISCSDTFGTAVEDDDGHLLGYDSDGPSDLGGHLIAVEDGTPQWGISKSWTGGDGLDCGFFIPEPEPTEECVGPVEIEVRHADTGAIVTGDAEGTFDGSTIDLDTDGETDAGTFDCDTDHTATLTAAPDGFVIVDGQDSGTLVDSDDDGKGELLTLVLTVDDEPTEIPTEEPSETETPTEQPTETETPTEQPTETETPTERPTEPETPTEEPADEPVEEPEVGGIVEECEGALEVVVIGPDGSVIDGPVDLNNVEIVTTYTDDSVECGTYTVTLDEDALAEGVSLAAVSNTDDADAQGPVQIVVVEDGDEDRVVFELVQVKGVTVERPPAPAPDSPDQPQPAPQPDPEPEPAPQPEPVQLARTGADTWWLLMLAIVALLAGTGFLRAGDRREQVRP